MDVRLVVAEFGLDRLRRSPSSLPDRCWQIRHHACMQACRFKAPRSLAHSYRQIAQNRHVHHFLHSIPNFYTQRSHELRDRFCTKRTGTMLVPISTMFLAAGFYTQTTCVFYSMMPSALSFETKIVGRVLPGRLDAAIHSQLSPRSILCRPDQMFRQIFNTCELPLTDRHKQQGPQTAQTGQKRRTRKQSHTRSQDTIMQADLA